MDFSKYPQRELPFLVPRVENFRTSKKALGAHVEMLADVVVRFYMPPVFNFPLQSLHLMAMVQSFTRHEFKIVRAKKKLVNRGGVEYEMLQTENYIRNQITSVAHAIAHSSFIQVFLYFLLVPLAQEQQLRVVEKIRREQRPS